MAKKQGQKQYRSKDRSTDILKHTPTQACMCTLHPVVTSSRHVFVFVYDCVVVSDLLLVEKEEKKGVGMDLVSIGRKWDS